jgi:hypothetical protein
VSWLADHQVFLAALVLIACIVIGLVVLITRTVGFVRTTKTGIDRVSAPIDGISAGLSDAERRAGTLTNRSGDVSDALEAVGAQTGELRVLLGHASRAIDVLRAPFRYLGR